MSVRVLRGLLLSAGVLAVGGPLAACDGSSGDDTPADAALPDGPASPDGASAPDATPVEDAAAGADAAGDLEQALFTSASDDRVPHIASRAGGAWIAWYGADPSSGDQRWELRAQRFDEGGAPFVGVDYLTVSEIQSESWVMDYALVSDSTGAALLAYSSTSDFVPRAHKLGPDGTEAWPGGLALTGSGRPGLTPRAYVTPADDLVVAWIEVDEADDTSDVVVARLSPAGEARWDPPLVLANAEGTSVRPSVVAGGDEGIVVVWVEALSSVDNARRIYAQAYDAAGAPRWTAPVRLNGERESPYYQGPIAVSDGRGGAFVAWMEFDDARPTGALQHVDASGALTLPAPGLAVSTATTTAQLVTALELMPEGDAAVAWSEYDEAQGSWGLRIQRIDDAGARRWAPAGLVVVPQTVGEVRADATALRPIAGGLAVFFGLVGASTVQVEVAAVTDAGGVTRTLLSGTPSPKDHPTVGALIGGAYWMLWDDLRTTDGDIWGALWPVP